MTIILPFNEGDVEGYRLTIDGLQVLDSIKILFHVRVEILAKIMRLNNPKKFATEWRELELKINNAERLQM